MRVGSMRYRRRRCGTSANGVSSKRSLESANVIYGSVLAETVVIMFVDSCFLLDMFDEFGFLNTNAGECNDIKYTFNPGPRLKTLLRSTTS